MNYEYDMNRVVGLDFETYSATDLRTRGMHNYMRDPHFKVLLAAVYADQHQEVIDFVEMGQEAATDRLHELLIAKRIAAHNAAFEIEVLEQLGIPVPADMFIDTAVLARAYGCGGSLEAAAPQVLGVDKMASGKDNIMRFCVPLSENLPEFEPKLPEWDPLHWKEFKEYCMLDAKLSWYLANALYDRVPLLELHYWQITHSMNRAGWPVDMAAVRMMKKRYEHNLQVLEDAFRSRTGETDLNLRSTPQLIQWCAQRGIKAKSFDEKHVARLHSRLEKRLATINLPDDKRHDYEEVMLLLETKREMGGSSLKKLDTILNTVGEGDRLYDSYLHLGAAATYRTTGRGVQMQNLKRIHGQPDDMSLLFDPAEDWPNDRLASNLRQVFRASHPEGRLIVGDFSSVESRALAWQAAEDWKLQAYHHGRDLYKVQAGLMMGLPYDSITKEQRQIGKVGELACGYGAGWGAVQSFAENMSLTLSEPEARKLVSDWRSTNDATTTYWSNLHEAMRRTVAGESFTKVDIPHGFVSFSTEYAPVSLRKQLDTPGLRSLRMVMQTDTDIVVDRLVHGVRLDGRGNVSYWKPSERKTGDLWKDRYTDPKTGLTQKYSLYGGKLAGLLTQSLCRQLFFNILDSVDSAMSRTSGLRLIGQFHDEIVLEWWPTPDGADLTQVMEDLHYQMTQSPLNGFPLEAEVKADRTYTK